MTQITNEQIRVLEEMILDYSTKAINFAKSRMPEMAKYHKERRDASIFALDAIARLKRYEEMMEQAGTIGIGLDQSWGYEIQRDWDADSRLWFVDFQETKARYDCPLEAFEAVTTAAMKAAGLKEK